MLLDRFNENVNLTGWILMKLLFLPLITLCLISGCSLAPQKLNRDNYLAISGDYEKPNSDYLTQVMGLPLNPYDSICRQNVGKRH